MQQEILRTSAVRNPIPHPLVPVIPATSLGRSVEQLRQAKSLGFGFLVGWLRKAESCCCHDGIPFLAGKTYVSEFFYFKFSWIL